MELRVPSPKFIEAAKAWHEDDDLNHATGFGRGDTARQLAQASLEQVLKDCPRDIRLFAFWDDNEPIAYTVFTDLDPLNHTGDLHITVAPEHQNKGYGPKALEMSVAVGMRDGLYRITYRPLASNRRAIDAGFKAGFKLEARTKYSIWTVDGPQDQAQMRVVKPEWRRSNADRNV